MAEYALIIGGIAIVVIAGILILGPAIRDLFQETGSSVNELPGLVVEAGERRRSAGAPAPGGPPPSSCSRRKGSRSTLEDMSASRR